MTFLTFQRPHWAAERVETQTTVISAALPLPIVTSLSVTFQCLASSAAAPAHTWVPLPPTPTALTVRAEQLTPVCIVPNSSVLIRPFYPVLSANES